MRIRYWLFLSYLLLLLLSHLARRLADEPTVADAPPHVSVAAIDGERRDERPVRLAYRQWPATGGDDRPVVLLLHGSPGSSRDFTRLAPRLEERFRLIAPDLPGFGHSTSEIPDYSILAHAHYCLEMLDRLGIANVHVLGFSMGGGVALHLAELAPQRVESVVLLSAIGVQELELLGQYHINHALHGLQLAGLWLLHEATPHFGALDNAFLDLPYARNFYDTDQRPLRGILHRLEAPLLILHGEHDVLVPSAAAREHHRLAPHSELVMFDANHFMVFAGSESLTTPLADFLERAENGTAATRGAADPARLAAAADPRSGPLPRFDGFTLVVTALLLALATLVSEDLTCIAGGLLVAQGRLSFVVATLACFAGIILGDLMLYFLGRLGRPWLGRWPLRWLISPRDVERSAVWFAQRGTMVIFLSRFLPGTRLPTYVAAGLLKTRFVWFAINLIVPAAIWTPLLVGLAEITGESLFATFEIFSSYALGVFVALLLSLWALLALGQRLATWRGRRLLVGWWRRKRHWEFWPPWVFYPPVVLYVLWLGLRHRSLTLFTAANPAIPAGGFIGESKDDILGQLTAPQVARFRCLAAADTNEHKHASVRDFMHAESLDFPIALKPDIGQRGAGVVIAHGDADIATFFRRTSGATIVQEYVPGCELGVFYVRLPNTARGRIFSITRKKMPAVGGDGHSTLEHLILADRRAVAMAPTYLGQLVDHLHEIPAAGSSFPLVELGTHCRGAIFLDGHDLKTAALEAAIDELARSFEGFFFGRFDLRGPSEEAFRQGRDFKVIELNGVTSEATHIYDPKHSLLDAYRVLFEQWRLAFEIGRQNRARGTEPTPALTLLRSLLAYRASQRTPPTVLP